MFLMIKLCFFNQFLAVLDGVHNTRTETPIVQLQSSKSAWFIRIKSHGLDLEKADFKNFLWFVRSFWKGTVYRSADSTEARRAHLYKHTFVRTMICVTILYKYLDEIKPGCNKGKKKKN